MDAESRGPRESVHKFAWLITTEDPDMFFEYPIKSGSMGREAGHRFVLISEWEDLIAGYS